MRKYVFGTVLAVFLMLSLAWVTPAQVKTFELQLKEEIEDKIISIGQRLENDENMDQIINLHENAQIRSIFQQLADPDSDLDDLAAQYINIIDINQLEVLIEDLNEDYGADIDSVFSSINNLKKKKKAKDDAGNYMVRFLNGDIKVNKVDSSDPKKDSLVFTSDGSIVFPNGESLSLFDWERILDFLESLQELGIVGQIFGLFIMIAAIPLVFGYEIISTFLMEIGFVISIVMGILGIISTIVSIILDALFDIDKNTAKPNQRKLPLFKRLRVWMKYIFNNFNQKLIC